MEPLSQVILSRTDLEGIKKLITGENTVKNAEEIVVRIYLIIICVIL